MVYTLLYTILTIISHTGTVNLALVNVYPKAQLLGVAGSSLTCYKTDQVSGWSVVAPCRDTEDACIIFG